MLNVIASRTNESHSPSVNGSNNHPDFRLFDCGDGFGLFRVNDGKIFPVTPVIADALDRCITAGDFTRAEHLLDAVGIPISKSQALPAPNSAKIHTISLAIAQKCNLGCTYCYAQQGDFGSDPTNMSDVVAREAIDQLIAATEPDAVVTIVFLGGEPLANRAGLYEATRYAAKAAQEKGIRTKFSLTTNATLVTSKDVSFFEEYGFSVSVSIDGIRDSHDKLRPFKSGRGSYDHVMRGAARLLCENKRQRRVTARVTVTSNNLNLVETLTSLTAIGFDGVQFAPMLSSPTEKGALSSSELEIFLRALKECSNLFERELEHGSIIPFSNLVSTVKRIHDGISDAYPCGAGGSYVGVSASGSLYPCHRFVDDEKARLGDVMNGVNRHQQKAWLAGRHLEAQTPCTSCWARHQCGGSCHYEALHVGRPACDYIRGWLDHCLGVYTRMLQNHPEQLERIIIG